MLQNSPLRSIIVSELFGTRSLLTLVFAEEHPSGRSHYAASLLPRYLAIDDRNILRSPDPCSPSRILASPIFYPAYPIKSWDRTIGHLACI